MGSINYGVDSIHTKSGLYLICLASDNLYGNHALTFFADQPETPLEPREVSNKSCFGLLISSQIAQTFNISSILQHQNLSCVGQIDHCFNSFIQSFYSIQNINKISFLHINYGWQ